MVQTDRISGLHRPQVFRGNGKALSTDQIDHFHLKRHSTWGVSAHISSSDGLSLILFQISCVAQAATAIRLRKRGEAGLEKILGHTLAYKPSYRVNLCPLWRDFLHGLPHAARLCTWHAIPACRLWGKCADGRGDGCIRSAADGVASVRRSESAMDMRRISVNRAS